MSVRFPKEHPNEWAFHLHHETLIERVTAQGINKRLSYIYEQKDASEVELRVKVLRIVKAQKQVEKLHDLFAADRYENVGRIHRKLLALHRKECRKDCPWTTAEEAPIDEFSPQGNILTRRKGNLRGDLYVLIGQGGKIVPESDWV